MTAAGRERRAWDHLRKVRRFYDRESERYEIRRYGSSDGRVAHPYHERLAILLEMFDAGGRDVLDCGCGPGILEPHLLDRGHRVVAMDLSEKMIERARAAVAAHPSARDVRFCVGSCERLPFPDVSFDAVVCVGVLSYWPDVLPGLREIVRVLRPRGQLVLQASNLLAPLELESRLLRRPYHRLRGVLTGRDLRDADFPMRSYVPFRLEDRLRRVGLTPVARRHYDFRPPLLYRVAPALADRVARTLLRASASRCLGLLAAGFLVKAEKEP